MIVATGNITNDDLFALFGGNLEAIVAPLGAVLFVELGSDRLIVHEDR